MKGAIIISEKRRDKSTEFYETVKVKEPTGDMPISISEATENLISRIAGSSRKQIHYPPANATAKH